MKKIYKKLVLKDNLLRGMIFTGNILRAGFYAALIREKIDLAEPQLVCRAVDVYGDKIILARLT